MDNFDFNTVKNVFVDTNKLHLLVQVVLQLNAYSFDIGSFKTIWLLLKNLSHQLSQLQEFINL